MSHLSVLVLQKLLRLICRCWFYKNFYVSFVGAGSTKISTSHFSVLVLQKLLRLIYRCWFYKNFCVSFVGAGSTKKFYVSFVGDGSTKTSTLHLSVMVLQKLLRLICRCWFYKNFYVSFVGDGHRLPIKDRKLEIDLSRN